MINDLFYGGRAIVLAFGRAELDDEVCPGAVRLGTCTPFAVGNGEEARLFYVDECCTNGG